MLDSSPQGLSTRSALRIMLRILKARSAEHLRLVSDLFQEYGTIPGIEACPAGSGREAGALLMERELP